MKKNYYLVFKVSRKHGIYVGGKRYRPVNAYGKKSGRPWINGPLGGKRHFILANYIMTTKKIINCYSSI